MSVHAVFKSLHVGRRLLAGNARSAGKAVLHVEQQRLIRTHCRKLAYAKDLFLGQVNKVRHLSLQTSAPRVQVGSLNPKTK